MVEFPGFSRGRSQHLIRHLEKNNGSRRVQEIPEEYMTN